jgi:hypothetical protein
LPPPPTQEAPEFSESFVEPLEKEVARASELPAAVKSKLVNDMLRYFILKGLGKEFIEKKKAVDDVMGEYKKEKIASVILDEATKKLKALYGWSVMQVPTFMQGSIPTKFKGRMYIVNNPEGDEEVSTEYVEKTSIIHAPVIAHFLISSHVHHSAYTFPTYRTTPHLTLIASGFNNPPPPLRETRPTSFTGASIAGRTAY